MLLYCFCQLTLLLLTPAWRSSPCVVAVVEQRRHLVAARCNYNNTFYFRVPCEVLSSSSLLCSNLSMALTCGSLWKKIAAGVFMHSSWCTGSRCWRTGGLSSREQRSSSLMFISQTATWEDGEAPFIQLHSLCSTTLTVKYCMFLLDSVNDKNNIQSLSYLQGVKLSLWHWLPHTCA